jgi:uncharacterized protein YndB with AHSA1/START domain
MRKIELSVEIHAPAAQVWHALATPDEIARWFAPIVTGAATVGEQMLFSWGPGMAFPGVVAEREEGKHLRWSDGGLVTDWFVEAQSGGVTIVRLVHSGWGDGAEWDDQFDATAGGWRYFLFNLRDYVEHHAGERRVLLTDRRPTQRPRAAVLDAVRANAPDDFRVCTTEAPDRLWGTLPSHGDALVLIENEPGRESYHCGIYISLYGDAAQRHEAALRPWLARMLDEGLH